MQLRLPFLQAAMCRPGRQLMLARPTTWARLASRQQQTCRLLASSATPAPDEDDITQPALSSTSSGKPADSSDTTSSSSDEGVGSDGGSQPEVAGSKTKADGSCPPEFKSAADQRAWNLAASTDPNKTRKIKRKIYRSTKPPQLTKFAEALERNGLPELAQLAMEKAAQLEAAKQASPPAAGTAPLGDGKPPASGLPQEAAEEPKPATGSTDNSSSGGGGSGGSGSKPGAHGRNSSSSRSSSSSSRRRRSAVGGNGSEPGEKPSKETRAASARRVQWLGVMARLQSEGMEVFLPRSDAMEFDWGVLAGYEEQKQLIEDAVLLALAHPDVFDRIARGTRKQGVAGAAGSNRLRALLLEGPPGTGKTTTARVIAQRGCVPLVNIQFERILSMWYGEDERNLEKVLSLCEGFQGGAVVFLDELDSILSSRDGGQMHECSRRLLGILLKHLDGFGTQRRTVYIGATNRKQDLDPALRSRFATTIHFGLPDEKTRVAILQQYAQHLSGDNLRALSKATDGMSGRELRVLCDQTELRWGAMVLKGQAAEGELPTVMSYMTTVNQMTKPGKLFPF